MGVTQCHVQYSLILPELYITLNAHCLYSLGGSVSVVVDRAALSDVARTNPQLQTVDVFAFRMAEDKVFDGIAGRCTIEATPTDTSDLQLALPATDRRHSSFCSRKSRVREKKISSLPPLLQINLYNAALICHYVT